MERILFASKILACLGDTIPARLLDDLQKKKKMSITVRPAQSFVKLNDNPDADDFDVMDGSRRIGQLYRARAGAEPWCWSISSAVAEPGISGRAATQVLALKMLHDMYEAVKPRK